MKKTDPKRVDTESAPTPEQGPTKPKKESKPKTSKVSIYRHIAKTMDGWFPQEGQPQFPYKFHVLRDKKGARQYLEEEKDNVVFHVCEDKVVGSVASYIESCPNMAQEDLWISDFPSMVKYWGWTTRALEHKIHPVLQKTQGGFTYHRLPFDFEAPGAQGCPVWDELLVRMDNAQAFMAWVGSLFDADSNREQYVWLYGSGRNGKGSIGRFLAKILYNTTVYEEVPERGNQFWTSGLMGKRLVIFGDCNHYAFPMSGRFKSLTGLDGIRIERKGEPSFTASLDCKFLFFSNEKPQLESKEADLRRAIFCKIKAVDPTKDFGKDYEQRLWAEAPSFLWACWQEYLQSTREKTGTIPCDKSEIQEIAAIGEDHYRDIFKRNFQEWHMGLPRELTSFVEASAMCRILRHEGITSNQEQGKYHLWLDETYRVKIKRVWIENKQVRVFSGICDRLTL